MSALAVRMISPRARTPQRPPDTIVGSHQMDRTRFTKLLGKTTWKLWYRSLCVRDTRTGQVAHALSYLSRMPNFERLSMKQVDNAAARLRACGLWSDTGQWVALATATGGIRHAKRRVVRGWVNGTETVTIPKECRALLDALPQRGWKKGRPRKSACASTPAIEYSGVLPSNNRGDNLRSYPDKKFLLRKKLGAVEPAQSNSTSPQEVEVTRTPAPPVTPTPTAPVIDTVRPERIRLGSTAPDKPDTGVTLRGTGEMWKRALPSHGPVPAYPGATSIGLAIVPKPPLLDPAQDELAHVNAMIRAYRGAVESKYPDQRCYIFARGDVTKSKLYPGLAKAALVLLENEIAPAAWAAFSIYVWKNYMDERVGKKPPPIRWLYSAKRLNENHGWFRSEEDAYSGGTVVIGRKQRSLIDKYTEMQRELVTARASTDEEAGVVVDKHFPDGLYDTLAAEARAERVATQDRIKFQISRGAFFW